MKKWPLFIASAVAISICNPIQTEASSTYTVQSGDYLAKIAIKYHLTIAELKEWNGLNSDRINIGQVLIVSKNEQKIKGKLLATSKNKSMSIRPINQLIAREDTILVDVPSQPPIVTEYLQHTIVKGDTLTKIAQLYGTTVSKLKEWNQLTSDQIYVGRTLRIESMKVDDVVPEIEFEKEVVSTIDQAIAQQLQKETIQTTNPSLEGTALYDMVLQMAQSLKGIPYVFGGNTPAGFDCSGFINYVYSKAGLTITRKSSADYFFSDTSKVAEPVPGDLVFFKNTYMAGISHMGIYVGNGEFIHAGSKGIELSKLSYTYWKERFVAYKRFNGIR